MKAKKMNSICACRKVVRWRFLEVRVLTLCLSFAVSSAVSSASKRLPNIEDYATIEAYVGKEENPVYAFGYTYVYGVSPDLLPGVVMQDGNTNPVVKFKPKKSWEIKDNFCGSTAPREPKTMWNDDQPLLPIHLIDGDPETAWSSRGGNVPDKQPEWIRIDLPAESTVASVALVCSQVGPRKGGYPGFSPIMGIGKTLPMSLTVKLSRDARQWDTVYENKDFSGPDSGPSVLRFDPRPAKQIWVIAEKLRRLQGQVGNWGYCFSIGELEVRDTAGNNLALVSRGAGAQVSSTWHGFGMDRFTQDMLWPIQYDLGFKWTRVGYDMGMFTWSYVEREKGRLQVDPRADEAISEAARNGVNVIMCLDKGNWLYHDPPKKVDWKKSRTREMMETYYDHPGWPTISGSMLNGYLRYVDYMVRHFKGRVACYEVLNEWVVLPSWHEKMDAGGAVEEYVKLLKATIPVIRKADPSARVMIGSLATVERDKYSWILKVIEQLRASGMRADAVGWHPWYQADPDDPNYRNYRQDVAKFKAGCAALGFKGQYAATEWTWAAPYPGAAAAPYLTSSNWCSEMTKAKYSAQLMTAHGGMDVISLYNETFQTAILDWGDTTLLRNAFAVDPISAAQPQPIYYVFRSISTVTDGFKAAEFPVAFSGAKQFDCYTFKRGKGELILAAWIPGKTKDGIVESKSDITLPGVQAKRAWVVDVFNGTEQDLNLSRSESGTMLKSMLIKDYPVFIRMTDD